MTRSRRSRSLTVFSASWTWRRPRSCTRLREQLGPELGLLLVVVDHEHQGFLGPFACGPLDPGGFVDHADSHAQTVVARAGK